MCSSDLVVPLLTLAVWPGARRRLKAVLWMMGSLGLGLWLVHGGALSTWIPGGTSVPGRGAWAFSLWMRILAVVSSGQLWLEAVTVPRLVESLLFGPIPVRFGYLIASPLLLAEQIRLRWEQIWDELLANACAYIQRVEELLPTSRPSPSKTRACTRP